jgi:hypothetical protein
MLITRLLSLTHPSSPRTADNARTRHLATTAIRTVNSTWMMGADEVSQPPVLALKPSHTLGKLRALFTVFLLVH